MSQFVGHKKAKEWLAVIKQINIFFMGESYVDLIVIGLPWQRVYWRFHLELSLRRIEFDLVEIMLTWLGSYLNIVFTISFNLSTNSLPLGMCSIKSKVDIGLSTTRIVSGLGTLCFNSMRLSPSGSKFASNTSDLQTKTKIGFNYQTTYQGAPHIFVYFETSFLQTQSLQKEDIYVADARIDDYSLFWYHSKSRKKNWFYKKLVLENNMKKKKIIKIDLLIQELFYLLYLAGQKKSWASHPFW